MFCSLCLLRFTFVSFSLFIASFSIHYTTNSSELTLLFVRCWINLYFFSIFLPKLLFKVREMTINISILCLGIVSMTVPVYIAEASPPHLRGQLVTVNTLFITGGQFTASLIDGAFSYLQHDGWRSVSQI